MSQNNSEQPAMTATDVDDLLPADAAEVAPEVEAELVEAGHDDDVFSAEENEGKVYRPEPLPPEKLQRVIEGALLAAGQPLNVTRILLLFGESEAPSKEEIHTAIDAIAVSCEGRGFELKEVASGWRFQVREEAAIWVNRLFDEKPQRYSRALLETLALIAYRQPITRGDIEDIRGVAVSSNIIKTLTEREWVKVVGHRDVPGRPALYATTRHFLDYFNLKSLEELPSLGEISDLESMNPELELEDVLLRKVNADAGLTVDDTESTTDDENDDSDNHADNLDDHDSDNHVEHSSINAEDEQAGVSDMSLMEDVADEDELFSVAGTDTTDKPSPFTDKLSEQD